MYRVTIDNGSEHPPVRLHLHTREAARRTHNKLLRELFSEGYHLEQGWAEPGSDRSIHQLGDGSGRSLLISSEAV